MSPDEFNSVVVRIKTSYWNDNNGIYTKKSISFLKRKCHGYNFLKEDADMIGSNLVLKQIVNLDTSPDGVYTVVINETFLDWETGNIDEWNYRLIPYES